MPVSENATGTINPLAGITAEATFQPATATSAGVRGQCPPPPAGTPANYVLQADGTWGPGGGGGGGGLPVMAATWSTGGTFKNSNVTAGVNLAITLSLNQAFTVTSVSVGGVALTGPFTVTGTFPSFGVAVSAANVPSGAQTNGGAVSIQGLYNSVAYAISGGTLSINAQVAFTVTPSAAFQQSNYPYWVTTDRVSVSATTTGTLVSASTTVSDGTTSEVLTNLNATTTNSYRFAGPTTDIGSATGNGLNGAPTGVVIPINITVTAPTSYQPLVYGYTGIATPTVTTPVPNGQFNTQAFVSGQTFTIAIGFTGSYWILSPTSVAGTRVYTFTKAGSSTLGTANFTQTANVSGVSYFWARFDGVDSTGNLITVRVD